MLSFFIRFFSFYFSYFRLLLCENGWVFPHVNLLHLNGTRSIFITIFTYMRCVEFGDLKWSLITTLSFDGALCGIIYNERDSGNIFWWLMHCKLKSVCFVSVLRRQLSPHTYYYIYHSHRINAITYETICIISNYPTHGHCYHCSNKAAEGNERIEMVYNVTCIHFNWNTSHMYIAHCTMLHRFVAISMWLLFSWPSSKRIIKFFPFQSYLNFSTDPVERFCYAWLFIQILNLKVNT